MKILQNQKDAKVKYQDQSKTEMLRAYDPLFAVMFVYGLDISQKDSSQLRKYYTWAAHVVVIVVHTWLLYMSKHEMQYITDAASSASYVTYSLLSMEVIFIQVLFVYRRSKFLQFIEQLDASCREILGNCPQTYRLFRWFHIVAIVTIMVGGATLIVEIGRVPSFDIHKLAALNTTMDIQIELYYYVCDSLSIISSTLLSMLILFFVSVTQLARKNFRILLKLKPDDTDCGKWPGSATYLRCHDMLCSLIQMMNEAFREMIFVWNFMELTMFIFILRAMNVGRDNAIIYDDDAAIASFAFVAFITKSMCAARVNCEVLESIKHLTDVQESSLGKASTTKSKHQKMRCRMYARYVQVKTPCLTGWGLYKIYKGFIWVAGANVITYLLVLYNAKRT